MPVVRLLLAKSGVAIAPLRVRTLPQIAGDPGQNCDVTETPLPHLWPRSLAALARCNPPRESTQLIFMKRLASMLISCETLAFNATLAAIFHRRGWEANLMLLAYWHLWLPFAVAFEPPGAIGFTTARVSHHLICILARDFALGFPATCGETIFLRLSLESSPSLCMAPTLR